MFDISDKIVCINAKGLDGYKEIFNKLPVEGVVYVVRDMDYNPETLEPDGIPGVLLVGIFGLEWYKSGTEYCFSADRFRKLDDYRTDKKTKAPKELEPATL